MPVSLGSDSCARDDGMLHNARAVTTQAHRLSRGRGILEVYNGPAFAHRIRASYGEAGVALHAVIEEAGNSGVERIGLFEVREVTRLGNRDELRARDASVHLRRGRRRRHRVFIADDDQRRHVNAGKLRRRIGTRHQRAERAGDRLGGARRRQRAELLDHRWPGTSGRLTEQLRQQLLCDRRRSLPVRDPRTIAARPRRSDAP